MKPTVTISKKWGHPQITTQISREGITLQISLDDFLQAVKMEMGDTMKVFDRVDLHNRIDDLAIAILGESLDSTTTTIKNDLSPYPLVFTKAEYDLRAREKVEEIIKTWAEGWVDSLNADARVWFTSFMKQLKDEIGSVTWTFRQDTFEKQVDDAAGRLEVITHDSSAANINEFLSKSLDSLRPFTEALIRSEVDKRLDDYIARVVKEGISAFIKELKARTDVITRIFTKEEFEDRLDTAIEKVLNGVKQESVKVV